MEGLLDWKKYVSRNMEANMSKTRKRGNHQEWDVKNTAEHEIRAVEHEYKVHMPVGQKRPFSAPTKSDEKTVNSALVAYITNDEGRREGDPCRRGITQKDKLKRKI